MGKLRLNDFAGGDREKLEALRQKAEEAFRSGKALTPADLKLTPPPGPRSPLPTPKRPPGPGRPRHAYIKEKVKPDPWAGYPKLGIRDYLRLAKWVIVAVIIMFILLWVVLSPAMTP